MTSQFRPSINALANDGRRQEPCSQYDSPFASEQEGRQKTSMNPYRQQQGPPELASGTRKKTPIRAVFYDLPTAHSSITSGSARSRRRATSVNKSEVHEEEDSIPLQDLEPSFFLQNLPLPPPPAILSSSRYEDPSDGRLNSERHAPDSSLYRSSLGAAPSKSLPPSSSLPEGSTIGNIYKHYARSDDGYDTDSDHRATDRGLSSDSKCAKSNEQLKPPALNVRKQRRLERLTDPLGQPPSYALPNLPNPALRVTPSTSHRVTHSSSYGDSHNLLRITQNAPHSNTQRLQENVHKAAMSRSNCRGDLKSDQSVSEMSEDCAPNVQQ
jgi:hypothetical protein